MPGALSKAVLHCGEHVSDGIDIGRVRQPVVITGGRDTIAEAHVRASANAMDGILAYCDEPVVSTDLRGNPHSSIFDALAGMQTEGGLTKLVAWYDNE